MPWLPNPKLNPAVMPTTPMTSTQPLRKLPPPRGKLRRENTSSTSLDHPMLTLCKLFAVSALPLILLVGGCKTDPAADFQAVQKNVSTRTGSTPEWPRSAADSEKLDTQVKQLLADELTPDTA